MTKRQIIVKIKHIGYLSLCAARHHPDNILRIDLGVKRYRSLGVRERFKNEAPYRVCKRCIAAIAKKQK